MPTDAVSEPGPAPRVGISPAKIAIAALLLGFGAFVAGFAYDKTWAEIEPLRILEWAKLAGLLALASVIGALVLRISPPRMLALLVGLGLSALLGPAETLSLATLGLSATALGTVVTPRAFHDRGLLSLAIGLCIVAAIVGWTLPFRVHEPYVYWPVALSAIYWRRESLAELLRQGWADFETALNGSRVTSFVALTVAGLAAVPATLPLLGYDDLAYHLRLPWELSELGYFRMDVQSQVWSVAPWAGDALSGALKVLSGGEAGGAVNLIWFAVASAAGFRLTRWFGAGPKLAWWTVALYASLPLTGYLTSTLQTELASAALLGVLCLVVARTGNEPDAGALRLVLITLSGLAAFKTFNALVAIPVSVWLLCKWRGRLPLAGMAPSVAIALLVAGSSYAYAAYLTGNPVLPLFNSIFHSPYYSDTNFYDSHWSSGITATMLWKLLFDTAKYGDMWDGAAGFSLLLLCGSLLVATVRRESRGFCLVALFTLILPLLVIQYVRYAYPGMLLLVSAAIVGLIPLERRPWIGWALTLVLAANVMFQSNAHWILRNGYIAQALLQDPFKAADAIVPEIALGRFVRNELPADARVVLADAQRPYSAEMPEQAFLLNWYDSYLNSRDDSANTDVTGKKWLSLFEETGATHVAIYQEQLNPGLQAALERLGNREVFRTEGLALLELATPWQPGRSAPSADGVIRSEFGLQRAGPALVRAFVELKCSKPGAPVAVGWHFTPADGKKTRSTYKWVRCRYTGTARDEWASSVRDGRGVLTVELSVAQPESGLDLALAEQGVWSRRDLLAERDMAGKLRARWRELLSRDR